MALHTLEICAGVGMLGEGLRAGLNYLGFENRTVCYLEREAYAASVLVARMEDESLDVAPVWPDLLTFDGQPWRGVVDCIAAGFPCQDLSLAGKRAGLDGARSGLFFNILDITDDCQARYLFLENVAGIASATASVVDEAEGALEERAAARVLGELADRGWNAEWLTLSASDVGASHGRARWFCFAWRSGLDDTESRGVRIDKQNQRASAGNGYGIAGTSQPLANPEGNRGYGQILNNQRQALREAGWRSGEVDNPGRMQRRTGHEQDRPSITEAGRHEAHDGPADGAAELGNARLQHQHLQQRAHGAEYPGAGVIVGDPNDKRTHRAGQQPEQDRSAESEEAHGSTSQLCGLFTPGPADSRWPGIIASQPHLAPALSKEAEFVLCGTPHGLADGLDFSHRAQRLKCVGNGVVALQAAAAFVQLFRRAKG